MLTTTFHIKAEIQGTKPSALRLKNAVEAVHRAGFEVLEVGRTSLVARGPAELYIAALHLIADRAGGIVPGYLPDSCPLIALIDSVALATPSQQFL